MDTVSDADRATVERVERADEAAQKRRESQTNKVKRVRELIEHLEPHVRAVNAELMDSPYLKLEVVQARPSWARNDEDYPTYPQLTIFARVLDGYRDD